MTQQEAFMPPCTCATESAALARLVQAADAHGPPGA